MQPELSEQEFALKFESKESKNDSVKSKTVKTHSFFGKYLARNILALLSIIVLALIPVMWLLSKSLEHTFLLLSLSGLFYAVASHINFYLNRNI